MDTTRLPKKEDNMCIHVPKLTHQLNKISKSQILIM